MKTSKFENVLNTVVPNEIKFHASNSQLRVRFVGLRGSCTCSFDLTKKDLRLAIRRFFVVLCDLVEDKRAAYTKLFLFNVDSPLFSYHDLACYLHAILFDIQTLVLSVIGMRPFLKPLNEFSVKDGRLPKSLLHRVFELDIDVCAIKDKNNTVLGYIVCDDLVNSSANGSKFCIFKTVDDLKFHMGINYPKSKYKLNFLIH